MGDGRGPAHRSPAPAALAKRVRRSVHGSVPPAAPGMHPGTDYSSTTLHYREPARGADYYLTSLTIVMHREDLRDLLYVSTRVPDRTTCYHGTRRLRLAVQARHEHDHISSFRPRVTLARLSPLRCLSGLRRCSHI